MNEKLSIKLKTSYQEFIFEVLNAPHGNELISLRTLDFDPSKTVNLRLHSECVFGDVFGYSGCDCGKQKSFALNYLQRQGNGLFIYHRQEGRGIGLFNKVKSMLLQKSGHDTVSANIALGYRADERTYDHALGYVKSLGVSRINLLTNNPLKVEAFAESGIFIESRIGIKVAFDEFNQKYLNEKRALLSHDL